MRHAFEHSRPGWARWFRSTFVGRLFAVAVVGLTVPSASASDWAARWREYSGWWTGFSQMLPSGQRIDAIVTLGFGAGLSECGFTEFPTLRCGGVLSDCRASTTGGILFTHRADAKSQSAECRNLLDGRGQAWIVGGRLHLGLYQRFDRPTLSSTFDRDSFRDADLVFKTGWIYDHYRPVIELPARPAVATPVIADDLRVVLTDRAPRDCEDLGSVSVKAAGRVPSGAKAALLDAARRNGATHLTLATVPTGSAPSAARAYRCVTVALDTKRTGEWLARGLEIQLAPTDLERRWGTAPWATLRDPSGVIVKLYAQGQRMPKLGVPEKFAYPPSSKGPTSPRIAAPAVLPATAAPPPPSSSAAARLARMRATQHIEKEALALLAEALVVPEPATAEQLSELAFEKLETAYHPKASFFRGAYSGTRSDCQQRHSRCGSYGAPIRHSVDTLRSQGRSEEALRLLELRARHTERLEPVAFALAKERSARILLLDMGDGESARIPADQAADAIRRALESGAAGAQVTPWFSLDASDAARSVRLQALVALSQQDVTRAEALRKRATELEKSTPADDAPEYNDLRERAGLELGTNHCDAALALRELARTSTDNLRIKDSTRVAALLDLAVTYRVCGKTTAASRVFAEALSAYEQLLLRNGGELGEATASGTGERLGDQLISAAFAPSGSALRELALRASWARKGSALRVGRALQHAPALATPQGQPKLEASHQRLAELGLSGIAARRTVVDSEFQDEWARARVIRRERAARAMNGAISTEGALARIRKRLRADEALVEYVEYRPYRFDAGAQSAPWQAPRYAAFVVTSNRFFGPLDLGAASSVDAAVKSALRSLGVAPGGAARGLTLAPAKGGDPNAQKDAFQWLVAPLERTLKQLRHIHVVADGVIAQLPFSALVNERGQFLLDVGYVFQYHVSGSELDDTLPRTPGSRTFLGLGDPDYGSSAGATALQQWRRLDQTGPELDDVAAVWHKRWGTAAVRALKRTDASRSALSQVSAPEILHIATHGWFLPDTTETDPSSRAAATRLLFGFERRPAYDPMLRVGLALAGANASLTRGHITALEVSDLHLTGTELVVLSACETALGELGNGESVPSLNGAFLFAGTESVLGTLWSVDDVATREFMRRFYGRLAQGEGRVEAQAAAARDLRRAAATAHPFFWAPFVLYGKGGPLTL